MDNLKCHAIKNKQLAKYVTPFLHCSFCGEIDMKEYCKHGKCHCRSHGFISGLIRVENKRKKTGKRYFIKLKATRCSICRTCKGDGTDYCFGFYKLYCLTGQSYRNWDWTEDDIVDGFHDKKWISYVPFCCNHTHSEVVKYVTTNRIYHHYLIENVDVYTISYYISNYGKYNAYDSYGSMEYRKDSHCGVTGRVNLLGKTYYCNKDTFVVQCSYCGENVSQHYYVSFGFKKILTNQKMCKKCVKIFNKNIHDDKYKKIIDFIRKWNRTYQETKELCNDFTEYLLKHHWKTYVTRGALNFLIRFYPFYWMWFEHNKNDGITMLLWYLHNPTKLYDYTEKFMNKIYSLYKLYREKTGKKPANKNMQEFFELFMLYIQAIYIRRKLIVMLSPHKITDIM